MPSRGEQSPEEAAAEVPALWPPPGGLASSPSTQTAFGGVRPDFSGDKCVKITRHQNLHIRSSFLATSEVAAVSASFLGESDAVPELSAPPRSRHGEAGLVQPSDSTAGPLGPGGRGVRGGRLLNLSQLEGPCWSL